MDRLERTKIAFSKAKKALLSVKRRRLALIQKDAKVSEEEVVRNIRHKIDNA